MIAGRRRLGGATPSTTSLDAVAAAASASSQLGYVADDALGAVAGAAPRSWPSRRCTRASGSRPSRRWRPGVPVVATQAGCGARGRGRRGRPGRPARRRRPGARPRSSVLDDADARAALVRTGRRRAARFTWEACGPRPGCALRRRRQRRGLAGAGTTWTTPRTAPVAGVLLVAEQLRRACPGGIGTYVRGLLQRPGMDGVPTLPAVSLYASRRDRRARPARASRAPAGRRRGCPGPCSPGLWDRGRRARSGRIRRRARRVAGGALPARVGPCCVEVVAVHDVAWRHRPEDYPRRGRRWHEAALLRALRQAVHFVVPSDAVAADLVAAGAPAGRPCR